MDVPCTNEKRHLFLTGEKGVGKSTLLKKLLEEREERVGGFLTVRSAAVFPGRISLHLLQLEDGEVPTEENFLCFCPPCGDAAAAERFDRLGCAVLARGGELLVMDELGPAETLAEAFWLAVKEALDGSVPVLGVLQGTDSSLYRLVSTHPNVCLVEVTKKNRDALAEKLKIKTAWPEI